MESKAQASGQSLPAFEYTVMKKMLNLYQAKTGPAKKKYDGIFPLHHANLFHVFADLSHSLKEKVQQWSVQERARSYVVHFLVEQ